jgi:hypothetical protein
MFCPTCKMEYRPEVTKCPDCDVWLVPRLPDTLKAQTAGSDGELEYQELVPVYKTTDYSKYLIAKSILEDNGIECFSEGDTLSSFFVEARVLVREADVDDARDVLEGIDEEGTVAEDEREE